MDNDIFIDAEDHIIKTYPMTDEHQIIKILERTPILENIGKIICGDANSNILTFEINRYYDGVDLYTKNIKFIVRNELGIFTENAVNLQYNDVLLRFSWVLSESVTYKSGTVSVVIVFYGAQENKNYALRTTLFTINVEKSLDFLEVEIPYVDWFINIEARILELETNGGKNNFETEPIDFLTEW